MNFFLYNLQITLLIFMNRESKSCFPYFKSFITVLWKALKGILCSRQ